jgi:ATP-binding cassette subfamily B protein
MKPNPVKPSPLCWRIARLARPYSWHFAGLLLLSAVSAPLALLTPLPLKIAVDNVIGSHPLPGFLDALIPATWPRTEGVLLALAVGLVLAVALVGQLRTYATTWLSTYAGERLLRGFRAQLFHRAQRLSLAYHDTKGTADSTYRIQYDAASLQHIAVEGVVPFLSSAGTLIAMVCVTAWISWPLALVGMAVSPVILLVARAYRRRLRGQSRELKKLESAALGVVHEVLGAVRVVKAFAQEEREDRRFAERSHEGMCARLRLVSLEGSFSTTVAVLTAVGMAAVLYIGVREIKAGTLTLGSLLLVMGYLTQIYNPIKTIGKKMASMQSHLAGAERAFALLDEAPDVVERPHARPVTRARGAMGFRNVSFAYESGRPVLRGVRFDIQAGASLGIAGATGAGKTTLMNLLTRFYDPTAGEILLDGVDLRDYKLADLRNQFAIVLQEPVLFSASIAENIAYARPQATPAEITAAAHAASAHEFIARLPQGYATPVGERGLKLSGGERQRISIARAFLKDAPILILDEPTSSVDVKTEGEIVRALRQLMRGRTTFIIAHRASTLAHCDSILQIEDGLVIGRDRTPPGLAPARVPAGVKNAALTSKEEIHV